MIITIVDYNFSLLPAIHRRRDYCILIGYVAVIVGAFGLSFYGGRALTLASQMMLVFASVTLGGYLFLTAYFKRIAFTRFISMYAKSTCTFDEMIASIPPCFMGLKDKADIDSVNVTDGYIFQLTQEVSCLVFVFEYVVKAGQFSRAYQFTIAQVRQPRVFPHLFLEGKKVGGLYPFDDSQKLNLEGDFEDYFNLYVPGGEQVDALTILTPDVMQVLVDGGRPYDLELIDDVIVVIAAGNPYTRAKLPILFGFMTAITAKLNSVSAEFDRIDLTAALDSELKLKGTKIPFLGLVLTVMVLLAVLGSASLGHL